MLVRLFDGGGMDADLNKLMATEAKKAALHLEHQHIRGADYYRNTGLEEK